MNYAKRADAAFARMGAISPTFVTSRPALLSLAAAVLAALIGCGSDGPTGPKEPTGKYPLTGTATLQDQVDHSGIRLKVVETGATAGTLADGSFTLPPLGNGDYTLKASKNFYSTLTTDLQVRDSLLVDPIGQLQLTRTFFIYMRSDSLHYTHKSDSVFIWMVLKNNDVERLDLFNGFAKPYDFLIYDPSEGNQTVWQWSLIRPHVNDDKYDFVESIAARDSLIIRPHIAWNKKDMSGTLVSVGSYDLEGWLDLVDSRGKYWNFITRRHRIEIEP